MVSVTNDLATDQRVDKVCNSLKAEGYAVTLIGRKLKDSPNINRTYKTKRFKLFFNKGFLFYAEYNLRLFFYLLFHKKDILLSNDLDTLLANYLVRKLQNKKLVYDSHELFTEVPELINRPKTQKIWLRLEQKILPDLKYCYTVCNSIAMYYQKKYNTRFSVIRNVPFLEKEEQSAYQFPFNTQQKKIILYQGALNVGRGLELLINTMQYIDEAIFVLVGTGDIHATLQKQVEEKKLTDRVKFLGRKTPKELKQITPKADLGISLEEDLGLNYRYALPNKIFDYIHAGIPMIVSDLPEMKKIITTYKVGTVVKNRVPKKLAEQLKEMLLQSKTNYLENLMKAKHELHWQLEEKKLMLFFKE